MSEDGRSEDGEREGGGREDSGREEGRKRKERSSSGSMAGVTEVQVRDPSQQVYSSDRDYTQIQSSKCARQ